MADPDLELKGSGDWGGGGGWMLSYLPCWPFLLLSFIIFLPKIMGGGGSPRSVTDPIKFVKFGCFGKCSENVQSFASVPKNRFFLSNGKLL